MTSERNLAFIKKEMEVEVMFPSLITGGLNLILIKSVEVNATYTKANSYIFKSEQTWFIFFLKNCVHDYVSNLYL